VPLRPVSIRRTQINADARRFVDHRASRNRPRQRQILRRRPLRRLARRSIVGQAEIALDSIRSFCGRPSQGWPLAPCNPRRDTRTSPRLPVRALRDSACVISPQPCEGAAPLAFAGLSRRLAGRADAFDFTLQALKPGSRFAQVPIAPHVFQVRTEVGQPVRAKAAAAAFQVVRRGPDCIGILVL